MEVAGGKKTDPVEPATIQRAGAQKLSFLTLAEFRGKQMPLRPANTHQALKTKQWS